MALALRYNIDCYLQLLLHFPMLPSRGGGRAAPDSLHVSYRNAQPEPSYPLSFSSKHYSFLESKFPSLSYTVSFWNGSQETPACSFSLPCPVIDLAGLFSTPLQASQPIILRKNPQATQWQDRYRPTNHTEENSQTTQWQASFP